MKKILLILLLISLNVSGQTFQQVRDLINSNLSSGSKITAAKHREVEFALLNFIQQSASQTGDIKRVKCDLGYLQANFDSNGLGKNLRLGWAICNGNNGTDNLAGRVGIGYGIGFSTLGFIGGSKDAVVVEHSHTIASNMYSDSDVGSGKFAVGGQSTEGTAPVVSATGVSGTDKNMQPYIINLYIMKL